MQYQQKLDDIERRFDALNGQMADAEVINDPALYRKVSKSHNDLAEIVAKYREWKDATRNLAEARPMLAESDPELRTMAQEEVAKLEPEIAKIEEELKVLLLPKDPNAEKRAASQNTAANPKRQPSTPESAAPARLPAWLNAWLRPCWALKPSCRATPSVSPTIPGPSAAPATQAIICEAPITQGACETSTKPEDARLISPATGSFSSDAVKPSR